MAGAGDVGPVPGWPATQDPGRVFPLQYLPPFAHLRPMVGASVHVGEASPDSQGRHSRVSLRRLSLGTGGGGFWQSSLIPAHRDSSLTPGVLGMGQPGDVSPELLKGARAGSHLPMWPSLPCQRSDCSDLPRVCLFGRFH